METLPVHTPPTLSDGVIILRMAQERDIEQRVRIGRDSEFAAMLGNSIQQLPPFTRADAERWYQRALQNPYYWVIEIEQRCVGYAAFQSVNHAERKAHYSIGLYRESMRNRKIGLRATQLLLAYAFTTMGLHRVDLRVLTINQRAIALYEKCGFVHEGVERESALIDGQWYNDAIMGMLEHEYAAHAANTSPPA